MAAELEGRPVVRVKPEMPPIPRPETDLGTLSNSVCTGCHELRTVVRRNRSGYEHFRWSHQMVLDEKMRCANCHEELFPYEADYHEWELERELVICADCHGG